MISPKTLHLTLKKNWFDLMLSGRKMAEFRKPSDWIKQRLINREYDLIKFINGYGNDKPFFICVYKGYEVTHKNEEIIFKDQTVIVEKGDYKIFLGDIVEKGNL
tara:strand:- start:91 stop:402 length:312 start_codon:yes stop_codon:yes gene_type:complete